MKIINDIKKKNAESQPAYKRFLHHLHQQVTRCSRTRYVPGMYSLITAWFQTCITKQTEGIALHEAW